MTEMFSPSKEVLVEDENENQNGGREQAKQTGITERGWLWLQGYSLTILVILAVIWIYSHPNGTSDMTGVIIGMLGFASAIIVGIYAKAGISEVKKILLNQNPDIAEIKGKVNGHLDRMLREQAEKHFAEMKALEAKAADDRHKRDSEIQALTFRIGQYEGKLEKKNETQT